MKIEHKFSFFIFQPSEKMNINITTVFLSLEDTLREIAKLVELK